MSDHTEPHRPVRRVVAGGAAALLAATGIDVGLTGTADAVQRWAGDDVGRPDRLGRRAAFQL